MNNLCLDVGYRSLNKQGEFLCGDHVDVITGENSSVIVLADGLGSGVKASILSTLTSKIISTMIAAGMKLDDCVSTIVDTLPVCSVRGVAYSTFSILKISDNDEAEIIQYDNPKVILYRNGKNVEFAPKLSKINGKDIYSTVIQLIENDTLILLSDGAIYAGLGKSLNFGWKREDIIEYMSGFSNVGFSAKTFTTILLDKCNELYGSEPGDDTTVCTVKIRKREPMNLLIGPPSNPDDCSKMMSLFFAKQGKHIVCGGTTSSIASKYLRKEIITTFDYIDPEIPPISKIKGVDLVTEGVITINKVLEYAKNYLDDNKYFEQWSSKRDGASQIANLLFEEATDINFFVGKAINPAHQNPELPINFNIKMRLIDELSECLKLMGKRINVSYF